MRRSITPLALVVLLCAMSSPAAPPATQPVTTDAMLNDALAKARAVVDANAVQPRGPIVGQMRSLLVPILERIQSVDVSVTPGRNMWSVRQVNTAGARLDAIRFKVPADADGRYLHWAFSIPGLSTWYIMACDDDPNAADPRFTRFMPAEPGEFLFPAEKKKDGLILQHCPTPLTGGREYVLWFTVKDDHPIMLVASLVLLPGEAKDAEPEDVEKAVGLIRKTPAK